MKPYVLIFLFLTAVIFANGQDNIGGNNLNSYYRVTAFTSNTVTCGSENLSDLQAGDKVMLIQMTGAGFFPTTFDIYNGGNYDVTFGSAGMHEFLSVLDVNDGTDLVTFTASLKNSYSADEKIQLVKIYESQEAVVNSTISVPAWDGEKGGILALVVLGNLTLDADIDLTAKGFRGGDSLEYTSDCKDNWVPLDTLYYEASGVNRGGEMGEGMLSDTFRYTIGGGNSSIGGGGGTGKFGGGAGGGNWGAGGAGGSQLNACSVPIPQSLGGNNYGASGFNDNFALGRASFGGGGGGGTYDNSNNGTSGGNGGGLIFIMADTLFANDHAIINMGQSVTTVASAGSGGGGAGGTILYDVSYTEGNLTVALSGGAGGSGDANCTGAGGGGSGGLLWFNGSTKPANILSDILGGDAGIAGCVGGEMSGVAGATGKNLEEFVPNLNGFTFNAISSNDSICYGQIPNEIIGTTPRGTTNFQYKWLQRSNPDNAWTEVGVTTKDYAPPALTDTMYYTREVFFPDDGIRDTAIAVEILVYPEIVDNLIDITDTICYNSAPGLLNGNTVSGGDGTYRYYWEASIDQASWTPKGDENADNLDEQDLLTNITYYWRIVTSGTKHVCSDTSNIDTITVLPLITNNTLLNTDLDTIICNNLNAGTVIGSQPANGDGAYNYSWLVSSDDINYSPISSNTQSYAPGTLSTSDYYYKRVVYSGEGNVCRDTTSQARYIEVLADITGNIITSDSLRYCYGNAPLELKTEGSISGGNTTYHFQWQQYSGTDWNDIALAESENYFPGVLTDTTLYRRIVSSGLVTGSLYACVDQSSTLSVDVIPAIQNKLTTSDEIICQDGLPAPFSEIAATGGAGGFTYLWEQNVDGAGWETADGSLNTSESYSPPVLYVSTEYRRVAYSQICQQISDTIEIVVYDSITGNYIIGGTPQYTCYNSTKILEGNPTGGGSGTGTPQYTWQSSTDGASWSNTGSTDLSYETPELTAETFYRRLVVSGGAGECKDTSSAVLININELPVGDIVSSIDTLCAGENIEITYEGLAGNGPWKFILGEPSNELHTQDIQVSEAPGGTIRFTLNESANIQVLSLQDDSTCFADLSFNTGVVEATVYEMPTAKAGLDSAACGLTTTLNAELSTENGSGLWTPNSFEYDDPTSENAEVTVNDYETVTLTWTETTWGHCATSADVVIDFYEQPTKVDAGEDQVLAYEFITTLDGNVPENATATYWKFVEGLGEFVDSTDAKTSIKMFNLGEHILRWTIENGVCTPISDSVKIIINDLNLPNGFSPNGDEINDFFTIHIPSGNSVKFTVFDRRGGIVHYEEGSIELTWDGTNDSGVELPVDTYFYIIEEEGVDPKNGFIDLRR